MPDLSKYTNYGSTGFIEEILDDLDHVPDFITLYQSVSVTLYDEDGTTRGAQTCRLVVLRSTTAAENTGDVATTSGVNMALVGLRDHATLADFAVARGDTFVYNGGHYEVMSVDKSYAGRTVALCEMRH